MMNNPNEGFDALLRDLERLRNSPKSEPIKISGFLSKGSLKVLLAKSKPIPSRRRKAAVTAKMPERKPKRIMVFLKKLEPLAKSAPAAPPRLVWTGHTPRPPADVVVEGWNR